MSKESQKICPDCLEPIPTKARKCIKCGSFQDWRRFTGQSATTLSLLIALITVSTFAYNTWRVQNPITGIDISTRMEQSVEILDVVNTGEVPIIIKSVRLALRPDPNARGTDQPQTIIIREKLTDRELQDTNLILGQISLRSAGVVNPRESKALPVEYVPGVEYADMMFFSILGPDVFSKIMSELNVKADGLSEIPLVCEYIVTYAFISKNTAKADKTLAVTANCRSTSRIGEMHRKSFCANPSGKGICSQNNSG